MIAERWTNVAGLARCERSGNNGAQGAAISEYLGPARRGRGECEGKGESTGPKRPKGEWEGVGPSGSGPCHQDRGIAERIARTLVQRLWDYLLPHKRTT